MIVRLTGPEKDAIRSSPCGSCGAVPPFDDGSRCHPHRIDPEKGYVAGNVVPRCPACHSEEPDHHPWIKAARKGGLNRVAKLTPAELSEIGRRGGLIGGRRGALAMNAKLTPAERSANARKAGREGARALNAKLAPAEHVANSRKGGFARAAKLTPAGLSAIGRRAHELHPDLARENGRKGGIKGGRRVHELYPDLARENGRRGALTTNAMLTTSQRSAAARKGWAAHRARQAAR